MYISLHVKCPLFLSYFRETRLLAKIKKSNIKFHENLATGSRIVPCGIQTDRQDVANDRFSQFWKRS